MVNEVHRRLKIGVASYRGLVMGGSTAECYGLSQQNSWPEILRCELSRPENLKKLGVGSVHIGNLGRSETPIAAQIQILEAIRSRYSSLDLIVFLVGASDAVGWLHQGAPGDRGVELMSGKRIFARESHGFEGNWRALAIKQITSQACRQIFRKYDLISNFSSRVARRQKRRQAATIVLDEVPNATALLDQWEADFLRLAILARSLARRVIFIQRAWFDGVSSSAAECHFWHGALGAGEEGDSPGPYLSVKALSSLMSLIAARSEALTKQHGIEILKVGAPITEDLNNYCDQFHFSVRGARLVAGRIAAQILASGE